MGWFSDSAACYPCPGCSDGIHELLSIPAAHEILQGEVKDPDQSRQFQESRGQWKAVDGSENAAVDPAEKQKDDQSTHHFEWKLEPGPESGWIITVQPAADLAEQEIPFTSFFIGWPLRGYFKSAGNQRIGLR